MTMRPFSLADLGASADPLPVYRRLQSLPPVFFSEADDCYVVSRHADVKLLVADYATYDPREGFERRRDFDGPFDFDPIFLQSPPDHTRLRKLAGPAFSAKQVTCFAGTAGDIARRLAGGVARPGRTFDLIADFAEPLVLEALGTLIALPPDTRPDILRSLLGLIRPQDTDPVIVQDSASAVHGAMARHYLYIRDEGIGGFAGDIVHAGKDGDAFSQGEGYGMLLLAVVVGAEDMVRAFGNVVYALWRHRDVCATFAADPSARLADVFAEALRLYPTTHYVRRMTRCAVTLGGVDIPAGAAVAGLLGAANRDAAVFADPDAFEIDRRSASASLTFGAGPHVCIGRHVARVIVGAGLMALSGVLPNLELDLQRARRLSNRQIVGFGNLPAHAGIAAALPFPCETSHA